jgi:NADH-quinone oxidoreductase subunit J
MSWPFTVIAFLIIASAVAAMSLRNLVHCVLCLTLAFAGLAAAYMQLGAQFVGFAQILVYIGAVAILIVFAILLTRGGEENAGRSILAPAWRVGLLVAFLSFGTLAAAILQSRVSQRPVTAVSQPIVKQIGDRLMRDYVLPLEVIGLLLTAAMIGAVIVAMQEGRKP